MYEDKFGLDEAALLLKQRYYELNSSEGVPNDSNAIYPSFYDFNSDIRGKLLSASLSQQEKSKMVEDHIFSFGRDMDSESSLKDQV